MAEDRGKIRAWVSSNIVPHEAELRAWLRGMSLSEDEISDAVQDAYVSISRLASVAHIRNGKSYFFQTAKMAVLQKIRRARIVPIEQLSELNSLHMVDDYPAPDRQMSARQDLERIQRLIADLPDRCRQIFVLRRIHGMSQREISRQLGLPEHTVEAQAVRGLKLISKAIAREDQHVSGRWPYIGKPLNVALKK